MRNYIDPNEGINLNKIGEELIRDGWCNGGRYDDMKTGALCLIAGALRGETKEDKTKKKDDLLSKESIHMLKNMPFEGLDKELPELTQSPYKAFMHPDIKPSIPFIDEHLKLNNTFENTYIRELSIVSHAHEILDLYREVLVATDENEKDKLWKKYRNQCVDLMLVLISEYDSDPERIAARLAKFQEKGEFDDKEKSEKNL